MNAEDDAGREALKASGISRSQRYPVEGLEDEWAAHIRREGGEFVEMNWRGEHDLGTAYLAAEAIIAWSLGHRDHIARPLETHRTRWMTAAHGRADRADNLLAARRRKLTAAQAMVDAEAVGRLRFAERPRGLDPAAAREHLRAVATATTPPTLVDAALRAADALAVVDTHWDEPSDAFFNADRLARPYAPPVVDVEEWYTETLEGLVDEFLDRWMDDFAGWAKANTQARVSDRDRRSAVDAGIQELVNTARTRTGVSPTVAAAAATLADQLPTGLSLTVDRDHASVIASDGNRLEVTPTTGRRVNLQLVIDGAPAGDPLAVAVSMLRDGAAVPLLDVLAAL